MSKKDRHLSKSDFLHKLQIEFYINEVRSKFYTHYKDREYYNKVMEFKKEKIIGLSEKLNGVVNIFNDIETANYYKKLVYPIKGLPQFPLSEEELEKYYSIDSEVIVSLEDGKKVTGKLIFPLIDKNVANVKIRGEKTEQLIHLSNIARIL